MRINVTQDCIERGNPGMPQSCPIAVALMTSGYFNPNVTWDCVDYEERVFNEDGTSYLKHVSIAATKSIQEFVHNFDTYGKVGVSPRRFNLKTEGR